MLKKSTWLRQNGSIAGKLLIYILIWLITDGGKLYIYDGTDLYPCEFTNAAQFSCRCDVC